MRKPAGFLLRGLLIVLPCKQAIQTTIPIAETERWKPRSALFPASATSTGLRDTLQRKWKTGTTVLISPNARFFKSFKDLAFILEPMDRRTKTAHYISSCCFRAFSSTVPLLGIFVEHSGWCCANRSGNSVRRKERD